MGKCLGKIRLEVSHRRARATYQKVNPVEKQLNVFKLFRADVEKLRILGVLLQNVVDGAKLVVTNHDRDNEAKGAATKVHYGGNDAVEAGPAVVRLRDLELGLRHCGGVFEGDAEDELEGVSPGPGVLEGSVV